MLSWLQFRDYWANLPDKGGFELYTFLLRRWTAVGGYRPAVQTHKKTVGVQPKGWILSRVETIKGVQFLDFQGESLV